MSIPSFGFVFLQNDDDALPMVISDFSTLGTVLPSDDALASVFPLEQPVTFNTGDPASLAALGTGPAYTWAKRVNAQLADLSVSARAILVRVPTAYQPDGVTEDVQGTIANIVGDPAARTGWFGMLLAAAITGVTPRVLGSPGYTGQVQYAVNIPTVLTEGNDYTHPVVTFSPPGASATAVVGNAGVQAVAAAAIAGGKVTGVAISNGGQDYGAPPTVTFTGGGIGANGVVTPTGHAVLTNGRVTSIVMDNPGSGLTGTPAVAVAAPDGGQVTQLLMVSPGSYAPGTAVSVSIADSAGGVGQGATASVTLQALANPVCAILPQICASMLAHAVVGGPGTGKQAAIDWRGTLADQRLIPVDDWEIIPAGAGTAYCDGASSKMGLFVRVDYQHAGYPFWSIANQPVQGLLGLKVIYPLSLTDGACDAQELLSVGIGVTARGDLSDTSLTDSGFQHVSYQNASVDPSYQFYNKTRGRDFTNLQLLKTIRARLGKDNITPHDVQAVLNDMDAIMVDLKVRSCVIGFVIKFDPTMNTAQGLRAGKFTVVDNSEEPAPILQITFSRGLDSDSLTTEIAELAAASNQLTG